jgi:signal transduction histidine kinase
MSKYVPNPVPGEGIPPQHLESIFNPFFTTKPEGVGLGLALVSKIADEHHGRIRVYSQPGVGTTFEMTLPKEQPA